jgi:hypothetical protein
MQHSSLISSAGLLHHQRRVVDADDMACWHKTSDLLYRQPRPESDLQHMISRLHIAGRTSTSALGRAFSRRFSVNLAFGLQPILQRLPVLAAARFVDLVRTPGDSVHSQSFSSTIHVGRRCVVSLANRGCTCRRFLPSQIV